MIKGTTKTAHPISFVFVLTGDVHYLVTFPIFDIIGGIDTYGNTIS